MAILNQYSDELRLIRPILIVTSLQTRNDLKAFRLIRAFSEKLTWEPLHTLLIDSEVWAYVVEKQDYDPKLVFCHPEVLLYKPSASLYYRGLCGLSLKAAQDYFGAVESLERGNPRARLSNGKALKMARIYNAFICSIIKNSTDWTLENGHRTIVATLGITLDGKMRNKIGDIAENRIRALILKWLFDRGLLLEPALDEEQILESIPRVCALREDVIMQFGSEPDISFKRGNELLAVVEIKGGIDPAGALER